jgi:hypothetical protein
MIERSDSAERIEPKLAREPMENAEAKERATKAEASSPQRLVAWIR